jgi:hypothetical protein
VRHRVRNAHSSRLPTLVNLIAVPCRVRFPGDFRGLRLTGADRPPGLTACLWAEDALETRYSSQSARVRECVGLVGPTRAKEQTAKGRILRIKRLLRRDRRAEVSFGQLGGLPLKARLGGCEQSHGHLLAP